MRELSLTSPLTTGPAVKDAQEALHSNVFGADYLRGPVDGVLGAGTARAIKRAKYWLGYRLEDQTATIGDSLVAYLRGTKSLSPAMKLRRAARLRSAARPRPLRAKALTAARGQLGVKESPAGSNRVKFSAWYGLVGPWCAMFVSWAYAQAGSKLRYAYVPYIVADARAGRNGLQVVSYAQAQPGDLVCYDWDGGVADHVGLLESKHGSTFYAIEGNTSYGNDSNGGEVMRRTRRIDQVEAFVRVGR